MSAKKEISNLLLKESFYFLKTDREIIIYSLLTFLSIGAVYSIFLILYIGIFILLPMNLDSLVIVGVVLFFALLTRIVLSFFTNFFANFFAVSILSTVYTRSHGGEHTLGTGLKVAKSNFRKILYWSFFDKFYLISIQIMNILRKPLAHPIKQYDYPILVDPVWSVMKYLIPSIMIIEHKSVFEAVHRAGKLSKENWRIHIGGILSGLPILMNILSFVPFVLLVVVFTYSVNLMILFLLSFIGIGFVIAFGSIRISLLSVYNVLCYQYAVTQKLPSETLHYHIDKAEQSR